MGKRMNTDKYRLTVKGDPSGVGQAIPARLLASLSIGEAGQNSAARQVSANGDGYVKETKTMDEKKQRAKSL